MQSIKQGGYQGRQKGWTPNYRSTFKKVPARDFSEFQTSLLKPFFGTDLAKLAKLATESITDSGMDNNAKFSVTLTPTHGVADRSKTSCFNRIYYGPPGTGKTYMLQKLLKEDYESLSTSISEQEQQAQFIAERIAELKWWEGAAAALYHLKGSATVPQLAAHPFIQAIAKKKGRRDVKQALWVTLQHHTVLDSPTVNIKLRRNPTIFNKTKDSIWHFAGDWEEVGTDLLIRNQTTDIYVTFCIYEKQVKSTTYVLHKSAIISSC